MKINTMDKKAKIIKERIRNKNDDSKRKKIRGIKD